MIFLPAVLDAANANAALVDLNQQIEKAAASSPENASTTITLEASALERFDSAGLAILLECRRRALASGRSLHLAQCPAPLISLAQVYGVWELLSS